MINISFDSFTQDQKHAFLAFERFFQEKTTSLFVLTGYAGTGKTTLITHLIRYVKERKYVLELLAPTGRAAKVITLYSGQKAYTIHKQIYVWSTELQRFYRAPNKQKNTIFIVDESSMLQAKSIGEGRSVFSDLMQFVYSSEGCKMILVGDVGQLPPVGQLFPLALDTQFIRKNFPDVTVFSSAMTEIVRQSNLSSIVANSMQMRSKDKCILPLIYSIDENSIPLEYIDFKEQLEHCYQMEGMDNVMVLTLSNRNCLAINKFIRASILFHDEELCSGDRIMIVKNNYFWINDRKLLSFLANGETLEVLKVVSVEEIYGQRFAKIEALLPNYPDSEPIEIIANLHILNTEETQLSREYMNALFDEIEKDYEHLESPVERKRQVLKNPYFNAVQVKYAFAATTHKAQGGQWQTVFIDFTPKPMEMADDSYLKWMYTSVTRAINRVFFLNFPKEYYR